MIHVPFDRPTPLAEILRLLSTGYVSSDVAAELTAPKLLRATPT